MKIVLRDVRMAFANIWEPKPFKAGDAPRFNSTFLFAPDHGETCKVHLDGADQPPTEINGAKAAIQKAIRTVAKEAWDDKADQVLKSISGNPNKFCFQNGDTKAQYDGFEGNLYIRATGKEDAPPKLVGLDGKPLKKQQGVLYAGCYTVAVLDVWAQDNQWGKGIQCSLLGIQFLREGDAFSAGAKASDADFEDLSDGADAPALDDEEEEQAAAGGLI